MVVDSVDVVTTTKQYFWEFMAALLQLLLSVDIVDMVFRAKRHRDSVPSQNYFYLKPLLTCFDGC